MKRIITINSIDISIIKLKESDYICLTDIAKGKEGEDHIKNWMRNRNTVEYLGLWESLNNINFKGVEFDTFKKEAGLNSFTLTPKKWIENTNAIGIISKSGRYGGTYAHKDIAYEFASWLSPSLKLYIIKEFDRLKEIENNKYNLEWNVKRILTKINYSIHTDAVKNYIIPKINISKDKHWITYAEEADILNVALFGCTAKQWRDSNQELNLKNKNIRDIASINELTILSNLESLNAMLIKNNIDKIKRFDILKQEAQAQIKILNSVDLIKALKFNEKNIYIENKNNDK